MSNLSTIADDVIHDGAYDERPPAEPEPIEVRRNGALAGGIGVVAAVVALAYLTRALGDAGGVFDWVLALGIGGLAAAYLSALVDARTPLMVIDTHGVRVRKGRRWHGLPWEAVDVLEHRPRRGPLRDGRLVVVPRDAEREFSVSLSLSTFVAGADDDLTLALGRLAADPGQVVEKAGPAHDPVDQEWADEEWAEDPADEDPAAEQWADEDPAAEDPAAEDPADEDPVAEQWAEDATTDEPEPTVAIHASATPAPLRDPVVGARVEVSLAGAADPEEPDADPAPAMQHAYLEAVQSIEAVETVADPVIGPVLVTARTRLDLSVDQLAERTRIRPHVIESIEADDFAPCGGDFYARGHLRTLARVLGLDAAPLLAAYDERYADAPIDARRVFEAELATGEGGPIRSVRGGPNWSVLIAAVMALVLAWSIARLIMDNPVELRSEPVLNGSPSTPAKLGAPVPVVLDAATGGTHVVVLDGAGEKVFAGDLAYGEQKTVKASPPVRVQASDGGLRVTIDGQERGTVGEEGQPAQLTFAADR